MSRTAVSKWESGRGYPGIESLKDISEFFFVSIDDLLSGEKLISIAEKENKSNIRNICDMLYGIADLFSCVLMILPLYPNAADGFVYSVNLLEYTQASPLKIRLYWILFSVLVLLGAAELIVTKLKVQKVNRILNGVSVAINILAVLFLGMSREAYAVTVAFSLLIVKGVVFFKRVKM